jgi:hypothetical protein
MALEKIDLHDAPLKNMAVDYAARSITISVDVYKSKNEREKMPALIIFDGVDSLSQLADIKELKEHTFAGHISYWKPTKTNGTTYIYLAAGCIAITAKKMRFKPQSK